jgi:hypothetical protein
LLANFGQLDVRKVLLASGSKHREQVVFVVCFAQCVQLLAEFLHQESGVHSVRSGGKFPIDIDAVEHARSGNSRGKIAVDEKVDAVRNHIFAACRSACGDRERISAGKRNQNLQIGMQ